MRTLVATVLAATLGPHGVGPVHFGVSKAKAVAQLSALFGAPTWRGVDTRCTPRYTEVEWGDLVVEFRSRAFSGYRYGTTLGRARAAYDGLKRRGAIQWQAANGLILVDGSRGDPASPDDRIVEIKLGTCGDF